MIALNISWGYGLDLWGTVVQFVVRSKDLSFLQKVQTWCTKYPQPVCEQGRLFGSKANGAWSWALNSVWCRGYTGCLQMNGAVSKVNKKCISHLTRAKRTPSAAATVQVSHALPAVRFSFLLRGRGASFQDGVSAGKGSLCAPFWGIQICDYSAAWVLCTV